MFDNPITYDIDNLGPVVRYLSPSRKFSNLRDELNNDARLINQKYGKVYLAFSSGVDSQVILRCFIDIKGEFEPFFIHYTNYNTNELEQVRQAEKFYNIKIKILDIDIDSYKDQWEQRRLNENHLTCIHYPFEWASEILPNPWPIVMSGANEPTLIENLNDKIYIWHNIQESEMFRFRLMTKYRTILDFPYSAESLSAYYCDNIIKTYCHVNSYYFRNNLFVKKKSGEFDFVRERFSVYLKTLIKGKEFKDEIIWFPKLTGYENFPDWTIPHYKYPSTFSISAPYNAVVEHLESCSGTITDFRDWVYTT